MAVVFDSRNTEYRNPFGAVAEGTEVFFRLRLPRSLGCRRALLRVRENEGEDCSYALFWAGETGDGEEWWNCHFAPSHTGLYWYDFCLSTDQGTWYVAAQNDGTGALQQTPDQRWQLTCYAADFVTPDWLAGGVMYQIFPDRFRKSGKKKAGVPQDRVMHENWNETPEFRPDATGEIRNNDFFGGDLEGIRRSLKYLRELGVTCLYLNPIFESASNHRYDTADYETIDPLLGTEAEFRRLMTEAKKRGIRVLLDGVFSHTGADSRYFNRENRYPNRGAFNTQASPYFEWYKFRRWPEDYASWWGFLTLPELNKENESYLRYITGENGVAVRWLQAGASGWRLDVADELPDVFLDALRCAVKRQDPQVLLLGEVWEDASNKVSYGSRRRYLLGKQLDSVMNYPFREAILSFVREGNGTAFFNKVFSVAEHYPPQVLRLLMNPLSTHDTARAITVLAGECADGKSKEWQSEKRLSEKERTLGIKRLQLASALQYCLPGVPCLYYGDEAGMEGYADPFNRGTFPWGEEDTVLTDWFVLLGKIRNRSRALKEGSLTALKATEDTVCFVRESEKSRLLCAVNRGDTEQAISLPAAYRSMQTVAGDGAILGSVLRLPPYACCVATEEEK